MKVLVTGGSGFTGSHTARVLVHAGHDVRLLVRDPDKIRPAFEPYGMVPTTTCLQTVDVRDLAALHVKLRDLPDGAYRYAAAADIVSWPDYHRLAVDLIGHPIRHITVPGWLLRAAGSAGDLVERLYDSQFPLTRDTMEFSTQWPGADAGRTTRELAFTSEAPKTLSATP